MVYLMETVEKQNNIIRLQSDVINTLFTELIHRITAEEADKLPVTAKINLAADLRRQIDF